MDRTEALSYLHLAIFNAFHALLVATQSTDDDIDDQMSHKAMESEFDKYMLWAGNVGILHSGDSHHLSLEYRLKNSDFNYEQVCLLLGDWTYEESISNNIKVVSFMTSLEHYVRLLSDLF